MSKERTFPGGCRNRRGRDGGTKRGREGIPSPGREAGPSVHKAAAGREQREGALQRGLSQGTSETEDGEGHAGAPG